MSQLPKPTSPIRILTIDGGGIEGVATLRTLSKLMDQIPRNNEAIDRKLRPCEVFDVIAGIGTGGWLALLLGRFQMSILTAAAEWYNLIECITPRSTTEKLRTRFVQNSNFDTDRLAEQVHRLTDFYETDEHMFFEPLSGVRCRYVFVAALKTDANYNLFRTYDCPEGPALPEATSDPRKHTISDAFAATGATKHLIPHWKDTTKARFKSPASQIPTPQNVTELALDEIWGLFSTDVEISVVVNIGPGTSGPPDFRNIAKRLSWGGEAIGTDPALSGHGLSSGTEQISRESPKFQSHERERTGQTGVERPETPPQLFSRRHMESSTHDYGEGSFPAPQTTGTGRKLMRDNRQIEDAIGQKLRSVYPSDIPAYYCLSPDLSPPGTTQKYTTL